MFHQEEREGRNTCVRHQSVPGKKGERGGRDVNKGVQALTKLFDQVLNIDVSIAVR